MKCHALFTFLFLLSLNSPAHALNCLSNKALDTVMVFNGFFEFAGGGNPYGKTIIFVNPKTGHYKIWIKGEKQACEVMSGKHFYILLDRES